MNGCETGPVQTKFSKLGTLEHCGQSEFRVLPNSLVNVVGLMPSVSSAQAASALVNTRGVRPALSRIPSTSTPNMLRLRGTNILVSHGFKAVDCGTLEKRRVLFELGALKSLEDDELRLLPFMGGSIDDLRAITGPDKDWGVV